MANLQATAPARPVTEAAFLADRMRFWGSVTKVTTYVIGFLVALIAFLWWWLV